jgi:hypothetical protein
MESKGTCSLTPQESVFWITDGGLIEDNIILSPFDIGLGCIGKDLTVRNNTLIGPTRTASGVGIRLAAKNTLETAIVTGNTVSNVPIAVQLIYISPGLAGLVPSFFGAEVSLNDFTGYTIAVGTSNDYILPSDLSVDGRGNYWGLTCAEGGFDPSKVLRVNGTVNPNVVDSYPYGVPVANTLEEDLPATCL